MLYKIQKTVFKLLLFTIAFISCSYAMNDDEDRRSTVIDEDIRYFYLNYNQENIVWMIKEIANLNQISKRCNFFSALFEFFPQESLRWMKEAGIKIEEHDSLICELWRSGKNADAIYYAQKASWPVKDFINFSNPAQPVLNYKVNDIGYFHLMCGHFLVSGDTRYINKIIDLFDANSEGFTNSNEIENSKNDAKAVLRQEIYFHERIYQTCLKEYASRSGVAKDILGDMITTIHAFLNKTALPQKNGIFNGDILITDDPNFSKKWGTIHINSLLEKSISSIELPKNGIRIELVPIFSGFELDHDLNAHVTCEIEIYDSEGMLVDSFYDLHGLKRKMPTRFPIQKADETITQDFLLVKSKDMGKRSKMKPGLYTIRGVIKDHIGKKNLAITKTLEILPPI
ncbi:MAG: hypothetical protein HKM07_07325 [Chlamydiae bacterium]|nr:hypothetical protein [Chlamydiota bacterium]